MKKNIYSFFLLTILSIFNHAQAAIASYDASTGKLIGLDNIFVAGYYYNVTFGDLSILSSELKDDIVYFDYPSNILAAGDALLAEFISNPELDNKPINTMGCEWVYYCNIYTLYDIDGSLSKLVNFYNGDLGNGNRISLSSIDVSYLGGGWAFNTDSTIANWTLTSSVPLPATSWFMISGLLSLFGFSCRSKRVNT